MLVLAGESRNQIVSFDAVGLIGLLKRLTGGFYLGLPIPREPSGKTFHLPREQYAHRGEHK